MGYIAVFIVGLIEAGIAVAALYFAASKSQGDASSNLNNLQEELDQKEGFKTKLEGLYSSMVEIGVLKKVLGQLGVVEESLKAERGRITITQAELETVETRLRELEEIERELEASGLETKEELEILKKKEAELSKSNDLLKEKVTESTSKLEALLGEIEMSSQMQEQVMAMQTELLSTEGQIDTLMVQIAEGNDQYFTLKNRYDALDIEYAQLYEKFSETEGGAGDGE